MYQLKGELINCFYMPASEKYPESYKVQIMGDQATPTGEVRKEMLTLSATAAQYEALKGRVGRAVSVPVGLFVKGGALHAYIPKNAEIASQAVSGVSASKPAAAGVVAASA